MTGLLIATYLIMVFVVYEIGLMPPSKGRFIALCTGILWPLLLVACLTNQVCKGLMKVNKRIK